MEGKRGGVRFANMAEVIESRDARRRGAQVEEGQPLATETVPVKADEDDLEDNEINQKRKGLRRKPTVKGTHEVIDAGLKQGVLYHDVDKGEPCFGCDNCPGFEMHFWRKVCTKCGCLKASHGFKQLPMRSVGKLQGYDIYQQNTQGSMDVLEMHRRAREKRMHQRQNPGGVEDRVPSMVVEEEEEDAQQQQQQQEVQQEKEEEEETELDAAAADTDDEDISETGELLGFEAPQLRDLPEMERFEDLDIGDDEEEEGEEGEEGAEQQGEVEEASVVAAEAKEEVKEEELLLPRQEEKTGSQPETKPKQKPTQRPSPQVLQKYAWVPEGLGDTDIERYFAAFPPAHVPLRGTPGEVWRLRQLEIQLPAHDVDKTQCSGLKHKDYPAFDVFNADKIAYACDSGVAHVLQQRRACFRCGQSMNPGDLAVATERIEDEQGLPAVFHHDTCFVCEVCDAPLADLFCFVTPNQQLVCGRHYADLFKPRCHACDETIFDDDYVFAEEHNFHREHLCCHRCDAHLLDTDYVPTSGEPVCLSCFEEQYAERCDACKQPIPVNAAKVTDGKAQGKVWHRTCFVCTVCQTDLQGRVCVPRNGKLYCALIEMLQGEDKLMLVAFFFFFIPPRLATAGSFLNSHVGLLVLRLAPPSSFFFPSPSLLLSFTPPIRLLRSSPRLQVARITTASSKKLCARV